MEWIEHVVEKFTLGEIQAAVRYFDEHGYAVLKDAFDVEAGRNFWADVESHIKHNDHLTFSWYGQFYEGRNAPLEGKKLPRIIDIESHSQQSLGLLMAPAISNFLTMVYGGTNPTCLQTLTYKFSSEQLAHSDKTLVAPPCAHDYDRETLTAAWLALEPANESNGALVIYPGSHKGAKRGFYDGFENSYDNYTAWLSGWLVQNGLKPVSFNAQPGDILFWHGDFVHAGGPILAKSETPPTRKSLVCHYARIDDGIPSRDARWIRKRLPGGSYFQKVPSGS